MLLYMSKINSFEAVYNDAEVFRLYIPLIYDEQIIFLFLKYCITRTLKRSFFQKTFFLVGILCQVACKWQRICLTKVMVTIPGNV